MQETLAQVDAKRKMDLLTILSMDYMNAVLRVPTNGSGEIRKIRELFCNNNTGCLVILQGIPCCCFV